MVYIYFNFCNIKYIYDIFLQCQLWSILHSRRTRCLFFYCFFLRPPAISLTSFHGSENLILVLAIIGKSCHWCVNHQRNLKEDCASLPSDEKTQFKIPGTNKLQSSSSCDEVNFQTMFSVTLKTFH